MRNLCNKNVDNEENFLYKDLPFDDGSGASINGNVILFMQVCKCGGDARDRDSEDGI